MNIYFLALNKLKNKYSKIQEKNVVCCVEQFHNNKIVNQVQDNKIFYQIQLEQEHLQ